MKMELLLYAFYHFIIHYILEGDSSMNKAVLSASRTIPYTLSYITLYPFTLYSVDRLSA